MQGCALQVEIKGQLLELLPDRAVHWPSISALLVADLHIGKGAAFRSGSIPLPAGSSERTLERLSILLRETNAKKLYILGDFWHAKQGKTDRILSALADWRGQHRDIEMLLVEGNHDRRSGEVPPELGIKTVSDLAAGPFVLKHHPEEDSRGYVLCGHIHPAVRLVGQGRQVTRLPAFWFGQQVGVLPAFGEFTGSATVYPSDGDKVFVATGQDVIEVSLTGVGSGSLY